MSDSSAPRRALDAVARVATGPPLDPRLRVTAHLHPEAVLDGLSATGRYSSQFVTGTGSGGRTAYPGGDRWRWEHRAFGGAYDEAPADERPIYGSLNHRGRPAGGSPRFGSAHLRLTGATLGRTTYCWPDSASAPVAVGVVERCGLAALADAAGVDRLDDYVEAQVHGAVRLPGDVEAVVLDPCYRGTDLADSAYSLGVPVEWHHGFRLHVDVLARHADYRGPEVVACGRAVAVHGWLDGRIIGAAAGRHDARLLKHVWHCTARFGSLGPDPRDPAGWRHG